MTEQQNDGIVEWFADLEADPKYQIEAAAAELAIEMSEILRHAFRAREDIGQNSLAEILGVSEGRVSQVLNGDGNFHVATIAKYLRALGYVLHVRPERVQVEVPPLVRNTRRKITAHLYKTTFSDGSSVSDQYTTLVGTGTEVKVALDRPRLVASRSLSSVKRAYVEDSVTATEKTPSTPSARTRQPVRS